MVVPNLLPQFFSGLKALFVYVGSAGGIWYVIDSYRKRARVEVRLLDEHFGYSGVAPIIHFEAENVGMTPTSIKPVVKMTGLLPRPIGEHDRSYRAQFSLLSPTNRLLAPHSPVTFEAMDDSREASTTSAILGFLWFKKYTFEFTRGRRGVLGIRSAKLKHLSHARYLLEWLRFKVTRRVTAEEIDVRLDR